MPVTQGPRRTLTVLAAVLVATGLTSVPTAAATSPSSARTGCPMVTSNVISPGTLRGGDGATQTITLDRPAPSSGTAVLLESGDYVYKVTTDGYPYGAYIKAGDTSVRVHVKVGPAEIKEVLTDFLASTCNYGPVAAPPVTIYPLDPAELAVQSFSFNTATAVYGEHLTATVLLTAPARPRGTTLRIYDPLSTYNSTLIWPLTTTVGPGSRRRNFPVETDAYFGDATLEADLGSSTARGTVLTVPNHLDLTAYRNAPRASTPNVVGLGQHTLTATVVHLAASSGHVHVPATVAIPAGAAGAHYNLRVDPNTDPAGSTVTITWNGRTATQTIS